MKSSVKSNVEEIEEMTRNDIVQALKAANDGAEFITATQLAKALHRSNTYKVKQQYLAGLEAISGKYYLVRQVAERMQKMTR